MQDNQTMGYLLVGHGTRSVSGQEQLREVHRQFSGLLSPTKTELGFLELAEPNIEHAVTKLANQGVQQLVAVPVLLFAAGHALQDIPTAVQDAAAKHRIALLGQSAPLELSQEILEVSALRFRQAVCQKKGELACLSGCQQIHCNQTALLMVGRGSRSAAATQQMRRFSQLRNELTPVACLETAFIYAQQPNLEAGLERMANDALPIVVVQPHLLFEGQLLDQIRARVAYYQAKHPTSKWIVTEPLGTDFALAESLANLARSVSAPIATRLP